MVVRGIKDALSQEKGSKISGQALPASKPLLKPRVLKKGDTIGIVAPSSPTFEAGNLQFTLRWLERLGLKYKMGRHTFESYSSYAGSDQGRLEDLHEFFADKSIAAVMPLRGGAGAVRLLPKLDFDLLARNPKIFVGFSDITGLLIPIHQATGMVTFHGPTLNLMYESAYTHNYWLKAVMSTHPMGLLTDPCESVLGDSFLGEHDHGWGADYPPPRMVISEGKGRGRLTGGCLTLIRGLMGTPYEIDTKDRIIFLEDVDEEPHAIDRMLMQLRLAGKFEQARGIIVGDCSGCRPGGSKRNSLTLNHSLESVLRERLGDLGIPVVFGMKIGHTLDKLTLPLGVMASLTASRSGVRLKLEEGACLEKAPSSKK